MKKGSKQDAELKSFLIRNDPAGVVDPRDSARLEMFIADRVFFQAQPQMRATDSGGFFALPHALRGSLSWPVALTGAMALGLALGFFVASFSDATAGAGYTIAMNGPWQHLVQ